MDRTEEEGEKEGTHVELNERDMEELEKSRNEAGTV